MATTKTIEQCRIEYREVTGLVRSALAVVDVLTHKGFSFELIQQVADPDKAEEIRVAIELKQGLQEAQEKIILGIKNAVRDYGWAAYVNLLEDGVSAERAKHIVRNAINTLAQSEFGFIAGVDPFQINDT